ncbi:GAF domain-containing protein [Pseudoduganella sp. UC29_106]|uniref:GAF domain-containing protein n=1 Tax=Pseudoduganella sp. UC29_106 TaxID=3374553 RepID=UPI003757BD63
MLRTLATGKEFVCDDVANDPRTRDFAGRYQALGIGSILIVPVLKDGRLVFNINVTKRHAYSWTVEDVRAAKDVLDRTWVALENAATQQRLKIETDKSDYILNHMAGSVHAGRR